MKSFPGKRKGILLLNEGLSLSRVLFLTSAAGSCLWGCEDKSRHCEPLGEACPAQPSLQQQILPAEDQVRARPQFPRPRWTSERWVLLRHLPSSLISSSAPPLPARLLDLGAPTPHRVSVSEHLFVCICMH